LLDQKEEPNLLGTLWRHRQGYELAWMTLRLKRTLSGCPSHFHSFSCHISCLAICIPVFCLLLNRISLLFSQSITSASASAFMNRCIQPWRTSFVSACTPGWYILLNSRKNSLLELLPVYLYWICIWIRLKKIRTGSGLDQHVVVKEEFA